MILGLLDLKSYACPGTKQGYARFRGGVSEIRVRKLIGKFTVPSWFIFYFPSVYDTVCDS